MGWFDRVYGTSGKQSAPVNIDAFLTTNAGGEESNFNASTLDTNGFDEAFDPSKPWAYTGSIQDKPQNVLSIASQSDKETARKAKDAFVGSYDSTIPRKAPERTAWESVTDTAIDAASGIIGWGESVVGFTDLMTGNLTGNALSYIGYDPKKTKEILESGYSKERQEANKRVQNAKGFIGTLESLVDNPMVAFGSIVQSAPMSLGGAAVARSVATNLLKRAGIEAGTEAATAFFAQPHIQATILAASSGTEGLTTTGSIMEQGRQAGRSWTETAPYATAAGIGTSAIGMATSKIPGLKDADATLAISGLSGATRSGYANAAKELIKGMIKEGPIEENLQSGQEQIFTNLALGKPWDEGVKEAMAQGTVVGAAQGGGMTAFSSARDLYSTRNEDPLTQGYDFAPPIDVPGINPDRAGRTDKLASIMESDTEAARQTRNEAIRTRLESMRRKKTDVSVPETVLNAPDIDSTIQEFAAQVQSPVEQDEDTREYEHLLQELMQEDIAPSETIAKENTENGNLQAVPEESVQRETTLPPVRNENVTTPQEQQFTDTENISTQDIGVPATPTVEQSGLSGEVAPPPASPIQETAPIVNAQPNAQVSNEGAGEVRRATPAVPVQSLNEIYQSQDNEVNALRDNLVSEEKRLSKEVGQAKRAKNYKKAAKLDDEFIALKESTSNQIKAVYDKYRPQIDSHPEYIAQKQLSGEKAKTIQAQNKVDAEKQQSSRDASMIKQIMDGGGFNSYRETLNKQIKDAESTINRGAKGSNLFAANDKIRSANVQLQEIDRLEKIHTSQPIPTPAPTSEMPSESKFESQAPEGAPVAGSQVSGMAQKTKQLKKPLEAPKLDRQNDDIVVAISKLGGLDLAQVKSEWGATIADQRKELNRHVLSKTRRFGNVFKNGGMKLDTMRETLIGHGYLPENADINTMLEAIDNATRGNMTHSVEKDMTSEEDRLAREYENSILDSLTDEDYDRIGFNEWIEEEQHAFSLLLQDAIEETVAQVYSESTGLTEQEADALFAEAQDEFWRQLNETGNESSTGETVAGEQSESNSSGKADVGDSTQSSQAVYAGNAQSETIKAAERIINTLLKTGVKREAAFARYESLRDKKAESLRAESFDKLFIYADSKRKGGKVGSLSDLLEGDVPQDDLFASTPSEAKPEAKATSPAENVKTDKTGDDGSKPESASAAKDIAINDKETVYSVHDTQLAFQFRDGTTEEEKREAARLAQSLPVGSDRSRGTLLGAAVGAFKRSGTFSFIGKRLRTPSDLAAIAQVYRNPSFETLRYFFVKDNKIVAHTGVSSRLPGIALAFPSDTTMNGFAWVSKQMQDSGADGYYILHNHPSGAVAPSKADLALTSQLNASVPGFKGHVIIDHNKYGVINKQNAFSEKAKEFAAGSDATRQGAIPHAVLGAKIHSPAMLADVGKSLQIKDGYVLLVSQSGNSGVAGIMEVPVTSSKVQLAATIKRFALRTGSMQVFAVIPDASKRIISPSKLAEIRNWSINAVETGFLTDVIIEGDTHSITELGYSKNRDVYFGKSIIGRSVAESDAAYNTKETDNGVALYSRTSAPVQNAHTTESLRAELGKGGLNVAALEDAGFFHIVNSTDSLPSNAEKSAKGFVTPDGQVYLVADQIAKGEGMGVAAHEIGVHYGLEGFLGKDGKAQVLRQMENLKKIGNKSVTEAFKLVPKDTPAHLVVEESIGYLAEINPNHSIIQRIKSAIKAFLFKKGWIVKAEDLNDADIMAIVKGSLAKVNRETSQVGQNPSQYWDKAGRTVEQRLQTASAMYSQNDPQYLKEYREIESRYFNTDGTEKQGAMLAPNGERSRLNKHQWIQVRTQSFKNWFGDWESVAMQNFLKGEPVSKLSGNEFSKSSIDLITQVSDWFTSKEVGGKAVNPILGEVILDKSGVKTSISPEHPLYRAKAIAFASVPDIIKHGIIINYGENWKGRGYDTALLAAPIQINGVQYVGYVVVKRGEKQKFYLEEVFPLEKLEDAASKTGTRATSGVVGLPRTASPDIYTIALGTFSVNPSSVSKVTDSNGEPMVVYHGSPKAGFHTFDGMPSFFTNRFDVAGSYAASMDEAEISNTGEETGQGIYETYLKIENPKTADWHGKDWGDGPEGLRTDDFVARAKREGNDGTIIENVADTGWLAPGLVDDSGEGTLYAVFSPNQIKSATDNIGAFDGNNPDIRYSLTDHAAVKAARDSIQNEKFTSINPEVQQRIESAHGLAKGPGLIDRIKETINQSFRETQHFPELDMKKDAQTADILRVFEASRQAATAKTVAFLKQLTGDFNATEMINFERRVLLDDLMAEYQKGRSLPFGYTPEVLEADHDRIVELTDGNQKIARALELRKQKQREIVDQLIESGLLPESVRENTSYFRHMVLEYANAKKWAGLGSSALRNKKRGWQKGREGSEKDINTNFLEAEFEVYSQQLKELATKDALDKIEKINNVSAQLKRKAKSENFKNLVGGADIVARIRALEGEAAELRSGEIDNGIKEQLAVIGAELDKLDPTRPFKRSMARGFSKLARLAADGRLPASAKLQDAAAAIAAGEPNEKTFNLISELAGNADEQLAMPARQILKAIADLDKMYREALGGEYLEHRRTVDHRLIPEGYVEWQPEIGNVFSRETTLPEQLVDKAIAATWSVEELVNSGLLKEAVVMGGKKRTYILPEGIAKTLDNLRFERDTAVLDTLNKKMIGAWKIWTLLSPRRAIKYNLNNMSGDLDAALAADPKMLKYFGEAWRNAINRKRGNLSEMDMDMLDRGVLDSGISVNEIPDISELPMFKGLTEDQRRGKIWEALKSGDLGALAPNAVVAKYFDKIQGLSNIREGLLREAAYRRALELLQDGKPVLWASNKAEIDAIADIKDKAAKLSRELVGDYGNLSAHGERIRARYIPFWSWMEINAPRYYRIFRNAAQDGGRYSAGARIVGVAGKKVIGTTAGVIEKVVMTQMLFALASAFNHLVWGDDDDDLDLKQLHLILGKDSNGKVLSLRFQGAFSDALSWFGLEDYPETLRKMNEGSMDAADLARKVAMATPNKMVNAAFPFVKLAAETITGKSFYPDITKPRAIRSRGEHVARFFSMDAEYRAIKGMPSRGYADSIKGILFYTNDPGEQAYNEIRGMASEWMEKNVKNYARGGGEPTARSNALYYYKQAKRYGDDEAAAKYKAEYKALGGTYDGMATSVNNASPTHGLGDHYWKFKKSLTAAELRKLQLAKEWYKEVYKRH